MRRIVCALGLCLVCAAVVGCGNSTAGTMSDKAASPSMGEPAMDGMMNEKMSGENREPAMAPKMDGQMEPKMDSTEKK